MTHKLVSVITGRSLGATPSPMIVAPLPSLRVQPRRVSVTRGCSALCGHVGHVLFVRSREKMVRANAGTVVAVVERPRSIFGQRPIGQDVGHYMRRPSSPPESEVTVPVVGWWACPQPARSEVRPMGWDRTALVNVGPEQVWLKTAASDRLAGALADLPLAHPDLVGPRVEGLAATFTGHGNARLTGHQVSPGVSPRPLTRCGGTLLCGFYHE
jgi:hypothetical protein